MKKYLTLLSAMFILSGCTKTIYLDENGNEIEPPKEESVDYVESMGEKFEIIEEFDILKEVRDVDTGVHYYLYYTGYKCGISPVYESDGSVRVTRIF